jgi:hypothetical protein
MNESVVGTFALIFISRRDRAIIELHDIAALPGSVTQSGAIVEGHFR